MKKKEAQFIAWYHDNLLDPGTTEQELNRWSNKFDKAEDSRSTSMQDAIKSAEKHFYPDILCKYCILS